MSVQTAQADHNRWRAHQMASRGTPVPVIAKHLGIDPASVHRYLRQPCPDQPHSQDQSWQARGACRTDSAIAPGDFFPPTGVNVRPEVRALCNRCPVLSQCREWAIAHPECTGVWGGLTERQRKLIRRERRKQEPLT